MLSTICWPTFVHTSCPQCDILLSLPPPPPLPSSSPALFPATVSLPATIVTSSVPTSVAGHMMYPSPHTVMYASTPGMTDGGLTVLNAFSQGTSTMQVSHAQGQDSGETLNNTHGLLADRCGFICASFQINPMLRVYRWENHVVVSSSPRRGPSGVPHSTSRHAADPRLCGAATPSTARSAFYK